MYLAAIGMAWSGLESQPSSVGSGAGYPLKNDIISASTGSQGSIGNSGEGGRGPVICMQGCPAGLPRGACQGWAEAELRAGPSGPRVAILGGSRSPPVLSLLWHRCSAKLCWKPLIWCQQLDENFLSSDPPWNTGLLE